MLLGGLTRQSSESFCRSSWDSRTCYPGRATNQGLTNDWLAPSDAVTNHSLVNSVCNIKLMVHIQEKRIRKTWCQLASTQERHDSRDRRRNQWWKILSLITSPIDASYKYNFRNEFIFSGHYKFSFGHLHLSYPLHHCRLLEEVRIAVDRRWRAS